MSLAAQTAGRGAAGWWASAVMAGLLLVAFAWRAEANHDEIEHLHAAWLIAGGQRPHFDFFEHHPPVFWWLLGPLTRATDSPHALVFAARLPHLLALGALLWLVGRIVRRLSPAAPARWSIVLLLGSFSFLRSSMEVRPDVLMCVLAFAGIERWLAYVDEPRAARALAAGLALGLASAVLPKALVLSALVGLSALLLAARHRADRAIARRFVGGGALFGLAAALPSAALMAALAARHELREFWFWNYSFNRFFHWSVAYEASTLGPLAGSIGDGPALWAVGAVGFRLALRRVRDDRGLVAIVVATGYALFLASNRCLVGHYFLPLLILLAVFAAEVFLGRRWLQLLAAALVSLPAYRALTVPDWTALGRVHDYILSHSDPTDRILVTPPYHPILRRDAVYFWSDGALIQQPYERMCASRGCAPRRDRIDRERWAREPPVLVYLDPTYREYHPPGRADWVAQSGRCRETAIPSLYRCRR